jgi:AGCS family alanine or glycine:cation symporter
METTSIDQAINQAFEPIATQVANIVFYAVNIGGFDIRLILVWLVAGGLFFTLYLGFINLRYFKHAIDIVRGKFAKPDDSGQISAFQALMTSLSGTVGLGNIGGVAVAVSAGGPGAVFWMALMGLFGMSAKFAEAAMGVKYRHHPDPQDKASVSGGPMYYLRDAFSNRNFPRVGKIMAGFFCICCIGGSIGGGNMFQANQSFQQFVNVTGGADGFMADKGWIYGLVLAGLTALVILGGIKSIARAASKIVPLMGAIYLLAGLYVIAVNYVDIPQALLTIFDMALTPEAGFGAVLGALLMGVQRAAFSNEAGIGSAAIVHATAKTDSHIRQGFVGMLGPFVDTLVICMVTALVIVITGAYQGSEGMEGVSLTSRAFEDGISFFPYILAFTVFLFAYSTLITWSYYGLKAATFLFGEKQIVEMTYKIIFCIFIVIGASSALDHIIGFSDAMIFAMAIPNLIGLYLLAPELKSDLKKYLQELKK